MQWEVSYDTTKKGDFMNQVFRYVWIFIITCTYIATASFYSKEEIFNYTLGDKCLDKSYESAIGYDRQGIKQERKKDLDYSSCIDPKCCCTEQIKSLFKKDTKRITQKRVNPATDYLIEALRNQRVASDIKIEELVYLKYVNSIYSFYDKDGKKMKKKKLTMPASNDDGCKETITFRKLEAADLKRKGVYREGLLKEILAMLHAWEKSDDMIVEKNMIEIVQ